MTVVFADPFVSASDQNLTTYNADYTMILDTDANLSVSGANDRVQGVPFGAVALAIKDAGPGALTGDYRVSAKLRVQGAYSGHVGVRGSTTNGGNGYYLRLNADLDEAQLWRVDDGVASLIDNWARTFNDGDEVVCSIRVSGSGATVTLTIVVERDAPRVFADSSASRKTSGFPIIGGYRETGAAADNFEIDDGSDVAFDGFSQSAVISSTATINHTPIVSKPRGLLAFGILGLSGSDLITSVTCNGVAMPRVAEVRKSTGEPSGVFAYFLGKDLLRGQQSVVFNLSAGAFIHAAVVSLDAPGDLEVVQPGGSISSDSLANPSVTVRPGPRVAFTAIAFTSGNDVDVSPLTNWTSRMEGNPGGTAVTGLYTYDHVVRSDVIAGWTQAAEDATALAVSIALIPLIRGRILP